MCPLADKYRINRLFTAGDFTPNELLHLPLLGEGEVSAGLEAWHYNENPGWGQR